MKQKKYLDVEGMGFIVCRTQFASMAGPPQNNVLLAVLPHELIQTPVAYGYSAQLNRTVLRSKIPYILCSIRQPSKGLLYCNGEVFISPTHKSQLPDRFSETNFFPGNQEFLGHRSWSTIDHGRNQCVWVELLLWGRGA